MTLLLAPGPPDPAAPVQGLVDGMGGQVLDVAVGLAPVAVPFVLALAAIGWVLRRFGLAGTVDMMGPGGRAGAAGRRADEASRRAEHDRRYRNGYDDAADRFY